MAQIKLDYFIYPASSYYPGSTFTYGFEFLNKEGKSILKIGEFKNENIKVSSLEENKRVIAIKAQTRRDPTLFDHGSLYNLTFKIAKLI